MVAAGAEFDLRLVLLAHGNLAPDPVLDALLAALACLSVPEGLPIGGGSRAGSGRIRLKPDTLKVVHRKLDADGELQDEDETANRGTAIVSEAVLPGPIEVFPVIRLTCDGPFLIVDSSWDPKAEKDKLGAQADDAAIPQLVGQKNAAGAPLLLAQSVAGALRARARWLWALHRLAATGSEVDLDDIDPSAFGGMREVRKVSDIAGLSPVERLFGISGFKGLMELSDLSLAPSNIVEVDLTSVKLDRFSGAPIDKALFKTRAFLGVAFDLHFRLTARRDASEPSAEVSPSTNDEALAKMLWDDIKDNGLVLGHGGNKGFGWFMPPTTAS
jgi:hypothetical protein